MLQFLPARRTASAVCAAAVALCLSVRPSQVGILSKWLNIKSRKQNATPIPRESSFLTPKILLKYRWAAAVFAGPDHGPTGPWGMKPTTGPSLSLKDRKFSLYKFRGPKWSLSYFANFRCTGLSGPYRSGPWGFSLTSVIDDPSLGFRNIVRKIRQTDRQTLLKTIPRDYRRRG